MLKTCFLLIATIITFLLSEPVRGATTAPAPTGDLADPLFYLQKKLVVVEARLNATDRALRSANYQSKIKTDQAKQYRLGTQLLDRNKGVPQNINWQSFMARRQTSFFIIRSIPTRTITREPISLRSWRRRDARIRDQQDH